MIGEIPYKEHKAADLVRKIDGGYRLPIPEGTPNEMYVVLIFLCVKISLFVRSIQVP